MALITEDGTGLSTAESYASVATADAYWSARNNTTWAGLTTAAKEASLRLATEYLGAKYVDRWRGLRVKTTQALEWPRSSVCVDGVTLAYNAVPVQLQRAVCELALKAASASLVADEGAQVKSETVGPLEVVYADGARQQTRFAYVESLLSPLLSGAGTIKVVRG
jgi:hypothetical protein